MNTPLFRERRINLLSRVKPALHPILWVDEGADLDDENASMMKWMLVVPSIVLEVGSLDFRCWSHMVVEDNLLTSYQKFRLTINLSGNVVAMSTKGYSGPDGSPCINVQTALSG